MSREELQEQQPKKAKTKLNKMSADPVFLEQLKKSSRTRNLLIVFIILLLLGLGALAYLGYDLLFLKQQDNGLTAITPPPTDIDNVVEDNTSSNQVTIKTTTIPPLASFFGLTMSEVHDLLGDDYVLTKTDEASDADNPAVKQLVVFTYQPSGSTGTPASVVVPNIYLSLDDKDIVVGVYLMSSFEVLGYPPATFVSFVTTQDMLFNMLRAAGITPAASYSFVSPTAAEYTIFADPSAAVKRVKKEEFVFSGPSSSQTAPTVWQVKLSYDYGAIGVPQGATTTPNQRIISISLR